MDAQLELLKAYGQDHLLKFYDELTEEQRSVLLADIAEVDWAKLDKMYREQVGSQTNENFSMKPDSKVNENLIEELSSKCVAGTSISSENALSEYKRIGLENIKCRKVAALLLAGGQGTRLGVNYPKGMYDVGSPINKSLFQLQAERIKQIISEDGPDNRTKSRIIWYIMTSQATMSATQKFFKDNDYFGLDSDKVVFFEQNKLPCFAFDGKVLLDEKHKLAKAPDGNGGIYDSLSDKGILNHMRVNQVEYVHVYCVDNILVRVCDPIFLGYCISKGVDVGVKVVEKRSPDESLGVLCRYDGKFKVIEYSEISDEVAQRRDISTGKLVFRAGSICDHFFSVSFLASLVGKKLPYHIAVKKIPHIDLESGQYIKPEKPNGLKFEKFIFDVFEYTDRLAAWEVWREDEFSPLKNGPGSEKDNPSTALDSLLRAYEHGLLTH